MAQVKVTNVQYPMVWNTEITKEDVNQEVVIDVQPGFILTGLAVSIRTIFDGTTPTFGITDNKQTPTVYIAAATVATAVGNTTAIPATLYTEYPSGGKIRILFVSGATAPTVGRADVIVQGVVRGRQNERVGANIAT